MQSDWSQFYTQAVGVKLHAYFSKVGAVVKQQNKFNLRIFPGADATLQTNEPSHWPN